jgi:hypothetical protein
MDIGGTGERKKSLEHEQQHDIYKTLESFEKLYVSQAIHYIEYKMHSINEAVEQRVGA